MSKPSNTDNDSGEHAFIQRYLAPLAAGYPGAIGLNDDCAALTVDEGQQLIATVDAVASDVHFFSTDHPGDIAWKALAVNVSDLAAKGSAPFAYLMSLAFPATPEDAWMAEFAQGLQAAQSEFGMHLVGGDTDVRDGPLTITITALGQQPQGTMVNRSGGKPGDRLLATGTIGDSFLGLQVRGATDTALAAVDLPKTARDAVLQRYLRPSPRLEMRTALRRFARASIDVSDGLVKDVTTLAASSGLGAEINAAAIPLSTAARQFLEHNAFTLEQLLTGGGDYEIVAAVAAEHASEVIAETERAGLAVTDIGSLTAATGVTLKDAMGAAMTLSETGYDHFSNR